MPEKRKVCGQSGLVIFWRYGKSVLAVSHVWAFMQFIHEGPWPIHSTGIYSFDLVMNITFDTDPPTITNINSITKQK